MKLLPARIPAFLRDPGECRVVLLFGEDAGMIRDRAETLVRAVAGSLDDPFLVTELPREDDQAAAERGCRPVADGRTARDPDARCHRCRHRPGAGGAERPRAGTGGAGGTGTGVAVKLRSALEAAPDGAAIGCYPEEGRALEETIRETLRANGAGIEPDALSWLSQQLGADRASTRAELEKLALYAGPGNRVDLDAAMTCVGDLAGLVAG